MCEPLLGFEPRDKDPHDQVRGPKMPLRLRPL
jgi:hypothetical protein